jgi:uncharacterized protein YndB with AHSA1/START domain
MIKEVQETSVHLQIVVDAPIERAFRVFTEEFDRIKPREHNLLRVEIAETIFEPRVGGHVYDRGVDGSECRWARVLAYEPPHRVVMVSVAMKSAGRLDHRALADALRRVLRRGLTICHEQ